MSFNINSKLSFIDSFYFLSTPWDSLVKILNKDDFKYLSQKLGINVLNLAKQKEFYCINLWMISKSLKKNFKQRKFL